MLEHTYFLKSGQKWISFLALDDDFDNSIKKVLIYKDNKQKRKQFA